MIIIISGAVKIIDLSQMIVMTDADIIEFLQTQSFFSHGDGHPQRSLVFFKTAAGNPGRRSGELNDVEDNEDITMVNPGKKARERRKIWPAGGDNQ